MSEAPTRRVVTGLDAQGRSCVLVDGPVLPARADGSRGVEIAWRTDTVPADNSAQADVAPVPFDFELMHGGGTVFLLNEYPPGMHTFWHATDTIDYIVVLEGAVVLMLETGEVRVKAGELIVDRGVNH
ncbi:MAG: cupin domain-containing protein, partial [Novosphingobium sp.]|nr:cupin domain-containing protein [Novosphingobium sp.]